MLCWSALSLLPLLLALLGAAEETSAYFADWGMIGGRPQEPTCVDIPQNMPLCSGIDYTKMRLPNLLEHDTLKEAQQQAGYWVPLLNLRCHPDTQLFLCSLFTPVCLESPIYPCRSLCEAVRSGCESRMQTYSFPWPDMLRCDKFPLDNDMCITVQHTKMPGPEIAQGDCEACTPVETYENILDNYCRADVVVKTRIKRMQRSKLICRKAKIYKSGTSEEERRALKRPKFSLTMEADCCEISPSRVRYLIMGRKHGDELIPTFIMPFKKSKPLRQAMKTFKRGLNCSDPNLITRNLEPTALSQEPPPQQPEPKTKGRRKNRKGSSGGSKGPDRGGRRRKAEGGRRRGRPNGGSRRKTPSIPEEEETIPMDITPIPEVISPEDSSILFDPSQPRPLDVPSADLQEGPQPSLAGGGGGGGRGGERRGEDGDRQAKKRRRKGNKASRRDRRKETVTEEPSLLQEE
ncbi:secreted frizzled-related protein 5-like isoform X1 [Macrobrachium nipponense]|uniref:secreted frizzled-related protein 5-like isoform X1 n=1 Tax=Macrobrachium nipponense TaxID=159736 RepID=UPI0030C89FF5